MSLVEPPVGAEQLFGLLQLAETLRLQRPNMLEPQQLPGRYGRVIQAIDRVLAAMRCPALLAGGWAVWRHGYVSRVTQDVDIVLPADRIDEFMQVAAVSGFEILSSPAGRWPKLIHKDTGIQVDILLEGARPGTAVAPAPTTIPNPEQMGAKCGMLVYIGLPEIVELKLAAGRQRDLADVVELMRANPTEADAVRRHLQTVHEFYVASFDRCRAEAQQADE